MARILQIIAMHSSERRITACLNHAPYPYVTLFSSKAFCVPIYFYCKSAAVGRSGVASRPTCPFSSEYGPGLPPKIQVFQYTTVALLSMIIQKRTTL